MADWKLLSFYSGSGSASRLDARENNSSLEDLQQQGSGSTVFNAQSTEVFCTGTNVTNCVGYLNQELQLLGLHTVSSNNTGQPEVCSLLNRAYDLFRCYQHIYSNKEELENRVQRLSGERDHHKSSLARVQRQNESLEKTLAQETEKLRQLTSRHKVTTSKLKLEKDEVKCLQSVMHHKDLQFKHELKKKEREINKLKDRLHQMLMDKHPDKKVGMDLMHTVQKVEGRRGQWKPGLSKQEEEMYQLLVGTYEDRHRELVLENTELRDCLLAMQRELSSLLKQTSELPSIQSPSKALAELSDSSSSSDEHIDDDDNTDEKSYLTVAELNEGYYQMPYDMVRQEIERAFKQTCERIGLSMKRTWKKKPGAPPPSKKSGSSPSPRSGVKKDVSHEVQHLHNQIRKYKDIIQQQEQLIQRKAVQEEKMRFLKDHFLNITPFKEKTAGKEGGSRLLPATPSLSPAPAVKRSKTPNTADLFRALGLADLPREGRDASTPHSPPQGAMASLDTPTGISETATPTTPSLRFNLFPSPPSAGSDHSLRSDNH